MKMYYCAFAALLLAACSEAPAPEAVAAPSGDTDGTSDVANVSVESIAPTRAAPVNDQFIECSSQTKNGNTTRQFFLITGGAVKSYSQMQNFARNMCDLGQPDCALGWQGEKVGLYFKTNSGAVNQMLLDLDTLTMEKRLTTARNGTELSTQTCSSGPFPGGVTIE